VAVFDPGTTDPQSGRRGGGRRTAASAGVDDGRVVAPMQGTIVKVAAEVGDTVAVGDVVVVLEAMKMENHITAPRDGVVTKLLAEAGAVVQQGEGLFVIAAPDA